MGELKAITEIRHDAIHDDRVLGPRMFYAWDGAEDSTTWSGPHASLAEALAAYLDEYDPEDDDHVEVTLARPVSVPDYGFDADRMLDRTCDHDWPESAVERMSDAVRQHGRALEDAVEALVSQWCAEHVSLDGFWKGYGKTLETTAGEARAWLARSSGEPIRLPDDLYAGCDPSGSWEHL